jgi:hypothetical protein
VECEVDPGAGQEATVLNGGGAPIKGAMPGMHLAAEVRLTWRELRGLRIKGCGAGGA